MNEEGSALNVFNFEKATGEHLTNLAKLYGHLRLRYGDSPEVKPNDHCYWDPNWQAWFENDDHFRKRIKGGVS